MSHIILRVNSTIYIFYQCSFINNNRNRRKYLPKKKRFFNIFFGLNGENEETTDTKKNLQKINPEKQCLQFNLKLFCVDFWTKSFFFEKSALIVRIHFRWKAHIITRVKRFLKTIFRQKKKILFHNLRSIRSPVCWYRTSINHCLFIAKKKIKF